MESSRDDFVIAIRSAFLKKGTQQRFSLLSLIFFSIIFLILGSLNFKAIDYTKIIIKEIVYRFSYVASSPEIVIKKNYKIIQEHFNLYEENKKNKFELESLRSKKISNDFIVLENKRLKAIVDDYEVVSNEVYAKVLSDKQSPFLKSVVVNKGSKHDIKLGMIVLDNNYLVGKIVEVNYSTSRVLLISDINSKIPVIIEPYGILSILSGTGKEYGIIQYIKKESEINDKAIIYTSGSGSLFKAGIPIGRMDSYSSDKEKLVYFYSDFSQLTFVKIKSLKNIKSK